MTIHTEHRLDPDLARLLPRLDRSRKAADALTVGLSDAQGGWSPDPGRWSIAECIEHLVVTAHAVFPKLDEAIEQGWRKQRAGSGPFRYRWLDRLIASGSGAGEGPPRLKIPAPRMYRPSPDVPLSRALARFHALGEELRGRMEAASGLDLGRVRAPSPALPLMSLALGQWFLLLAEHEERHLGQAGRLREHAGFPSTTA